MVTGRDWLIDVRPGSEASPVGRPEKTSAALRWLCLGALLSQAHGAAVAALPVEPRPGAGPHHPPFPGHPLEAFRENAPSSSAMAIAPSAFAALEPSGSSHLRRSASADPAAGSGAPPDDLTLGGFPVAEASMVAARVSAVRKLLGRDAEDAPARTLLDAANRIHRQAAEHPRDRDAADASRALFEEEARLWAEENGSDSLPLAPQKYVEIYKELWELALNPPPLPQFKTRSEIRSEVMGELTNVSPEERVRLLRLNMLSARTGGMQFEGDARRRYYDQFADYIDRHLPKLSVAKAIANAEEAGLGRILMEHRPASAWIIDQITLQKAANFPHLWLERPVRNLPAYVVPLPKGKFGLIGPAGDFAFVGKDFFNAKGEPKAEAVLDALGVTFRAGWNDHDTAFGCRFTADTCHLKHFKVSKEFVLLNGASLKDIMASRVKSFALDEIARWKEENYDPSVGEVVASAVVPFYDMIRKASYDRHYKPSLNEVLAELPSLAFSLIPVGMAATKAFGAGVKVAARAAAAALAKEMADFVVPVFTAKSVFSATGRGAKAIARKTLKHALKNSDDGLAKLSRFAPAGQRGRTSSLLGKAATSRFTIEEAMQLVGERPSSRFLDEQSGFVYRGFVFRGDMRPPEEIFGRGFELRTKVEDIGEVNGFRGGFGGGRNALDMDGKGISTSPYAFTEEGAGADFYGRERNGYTYLVDARDLDGYDLYKNAAFNRFRTNFRYDAAQAARAAAEAHPRPLEVNYGVDISGRHIIGAFDRSGRYIPNRGYERLVTLDDQALPSAGGVAVKTGRFGTRVVPQARDGSDRRDPASGRGQAAKSRAPFRPRAV